jgi:hypothetical protein
MIAKLPQMIAAGCLLICVVSGIRAASATDAPRQPENSGGQAAVSDRELSSFVKAYVDYQRIRSQFAPALAKEKDPTRKKQIEQEANTKVKRSLDTNGLSSERYNRIFATVNGSESLRKRVLKQVEEERKNS